MPDTADPLAGAYFIEHLTNEMEKEASRIMDTIQQLGGSVAAIEQGYMQDEIAASAYRFQQQLEKKEKIIVLCASVRRCLTLFTNTNH